MDTVNGAPGDGQAARDPLIGRVLDDRYRILSLIAKGGMGRIYRAEQQPLGRHVALKVLAPPISADPDSLSTFRQRFFREASICSKLAHPNTVRIYDYGKSDDGVYFIAMEFLEGRTLRQVLAQEAPIPPWRAIELLRQVCASLAEAHAMGLIHRDLKPSNLIITTHADGTEFVNVVDFGLVKDLEGSFGESEETQAGMIVGSPMYMSPEQILQSDLTERTDIYSLGVILYGMLTGRKPFRQESSVAIMNCHLNVPPPPFSESNPEVDVSANLEWVTQTCLAKKPQDRFATVRELARALSACDKELRGVVPPFQLQLADGRLVLPTELEEALSRRGGSGSLSASGVTLHQPNAQPQVVDARDGSSSKVLVALLALILLLGAALGVAWWSQRGSGEIADDPGAIDVTENQASTTPPPEAPPAEPGGAGEPPEARGVEATPPPSTPAPSAEPVSPPAEAGSLRGSRSDGAAPPSPPPAEVAPPEPAPPEPAPPAETTPPPKEAPPETREPDWAKPQSDVRDPWGD